MRQRILSWAVKSAIAGFLCFTLLSPFLRIAGLDAGCYGMKCCAHCGGQMQERIYDGSRGITEPVCRPCYETYLIHLPPLTPAKR